MLLIRNQRKIIAMVPSALKFQHKCYKNKFQWNDLSIILSTFLIKPWYLSIINLANFISSMTFVPILRYQHHREHRNFYFKIEHFIFDMSVGSRGHKIMKFFKIVVKSRSATSNALLVTNRTCNKILKSLISTTKKHCIKVASRVALHSRS